MGEGKTHLPKLMSFVDGGRTLLVYKERLQRRRKEVDRRKKLRKEGRKEDGKSKIKADVPRLILFFP